MLNLLPVTRLQLWLAALLLWTLAAVVLTHSYTSQGYKKQQAELQVQYQASVLEVTRLVNASYTRYLEQQTQQAQRFTVVRKTIPSTAATVPCAPTPQVLDYINQLVTTANAP